VTRYRLPALALLVTVLLAVVAVAAHGRPLGARAGHGSGLPTSFWDYALTSVVILAVLAWLAVLVTAVYLRPDPRKKRQSFAIGTLRTLASMLALAVLLVLVSRHLHLHHLHSQKPEIGLAGGHPKKVRPGTQAAGSSGVRFQWDEIAVVLGLLLVAGLVLAARRKRPDATRPPSLSAPEVLAGALDESLDDLRTDPDLRRAIVAAYARMERALAAAGVGRRPPEAPLEYVERALLALHTSGPAVRRLTDLFEWARFSQHEPDPAMRDDAVDALEAVRDELRAPAPAPVLT
jgi:hypothetical protein